MSNVTVPSGIVKLLKRGTGGRWLRLLFLVLFSATAALAAVDICAVCKKEIRSNIYTWEDKVSHTKRFLCADCLALPDHCYLCSLPVRKDLTGLPDGRVICRRDVGAVVLDDSEAALICHQVKDGLDRQFIRSIAIPETNVTVQLMDRIKLQELFKIIGNDYTCPNTLGITETRTNAGQRVFGISLLSGLTREDLMTTCVHEYAHTWILENVPSDRRKTIGKDAVEGFCELLSFLFAEQQGLAAGKSNILANYYTRGQIHLFIAADRQYGFDDIADWMKSGKDPLLFGEDLSRVRWLEYLPIAKTIATNPSPTLAVTPIINTPPKLPERLVLKGITSSKTMRLAIINDHNFAPLDRGLVPLAATNLMIRCLEIRTNSVLIRLEDSGLTQELTLPPR